MSRRDHALGCERSHFSVRRLLLEDEKPPRFYNETEAVLLKLGAHHIRRKVPPGRTGRYWTPTLSLSAETIMPSPA